MAKDFNWAKRRHDGKPTEDAWTKPKQRLKGCWTHVERAPVRHVSIEEYKATSSDWPGDYRA
jgi:hypothetical protein